MNISLNLGQEISQNTHLSRWDQEWVRREEKSQPRMIIKERTSGSASAEKNIQPLQNGNNATDLSTEIAVKILFQ